MAQKSRSSEREGDTMRAAPITHDSQVVEPSAGSGDAAKQIAAEDEPIECASPPCYLSEIED